MQDQFLCRQPGLANFMDANVLDSHQITAIVLCMTSCSPMPWFLSSNHLGASVLHVLFTS
uniref:Uncharacterized protein n=1 Tax=Setaria italica TaxID=4555 RepID=K3YKQ0_SETIT